MSSVSQTQQGTPRKAQTGSVKNKTTSTGKGRGEAETQRTTLPASPLALPVEVVLFFTLPFRANFGGNLLKVLDYLFNFNASTFI